MSSEEKGNNVSKKDPVLAFLDSVENILENGKKYIMSRFLYAFKDNMTYSIVSRGFIQDGKKKYVMTLTLSLIFDEDEIIQITENAKNWHDDMLHRMRGKVEKEKKNADEFLERREEKLKKMKSKD